jgi:hypothetical protein
MANVHTRSRSRANVARVLAFLCALGGTAACPREGIAPPQHRATRDEHSAMRGCREVGAAAPGQPADQCAALEPVVQTSARGGGPAAEVPAPWCASAPTSPGDPCASLATSRSVRDWTGAPTHPPRAGGVDALRDPSSARGEAP